MIPRESESEHQGGFNRGFHSNETGGCWNDPNDVSDEGKKNNSDTDSLFVALP